MEIAPEYLAPYIISNVLAVLLLLCAFKWPSFVRWFSVALFIGAALFNAYTGIVDPASYVEGFGPGAAALYRRFITGFFAAHASAIIIAIAAGQLAVGLLMARDGTLRLGVLGAAIFLVAIMPLGVGSAFPFSLFAIAALVVMRRKLRRSMESEMALHY